MKIHTLSCPDCGTVVAGNVLESSRIMKCPGVSCEAELRFDDLPKKAQEHLLENQDQYTMGA